MKTPGPNMAAKAIANIRPGNTYTESMISERILSRMPPEKPEIKPREMPENEERIAAKIAILMIVWEP